MRLLMTSADIHALFFIGAYQDNEVNQEHPLVLRLTEIQKATLTEIQKAKVVVNHISLEPLTLAHVNQLIADALHCGSDKAFPLAELLDRKTGGNPFFLNEFLKSLSVDELLTLISCTTVGNGI
ncbi:MAG: hypothetical protein DRR00_34160 [Candidatus Parabeggiatoa sp. nov. 3]|nr:MAG: hypothetical protein DRR00_34160 [Gammaproteobacteria bacterium]